MASTMIWAVIALFAVVEAVPYSKYGRTCKDIGCLRNEICVMAEDPCTVYSRTQCGRYPTCQKLDNGAESCTSKICPSGQYCRTENGKPTCVNTVPSLGYDSAGVSSVNGQPSESGTRYADSNPYANANAPPAEDDDHSGRRPANYPVNSNSNAASGYPSYPSQSGNSNNSGYPPYPTNAGNQPGRTDLGYPPYPTQNRMPLPGQTYPQQPGYPSQSGQYPGFPQYPQYPTNNQKYPSGQYYPYNNKNHYNPNSIYRRNSATTSVANPMITITIMFCTVIGIFHGLS